MLTALNQAKPNLPSKYAINLMWLNKALNPNNKYICPFAKKNGIKGIELELSNELFNIKKRVTVDIAQSYENQIRAINDEVDSTYQLYRKNLTELGAVHEETEATLAKYYATQNDAVQKRKDLTEQFEIEEKARTEKPEVQAEFEKAKKRAEDRIKNATDESAMIDLFLSNAIKWSEANPSAIVNIWYDSLTVTPEQFQNTIDVLGKLNSNIRLRDVRTIDIVEQNPDSFSEAIPLYFRIDVLKLIICLDTIEKEGLDASIFSDLEVGNLRKDNSRMNKAELFNPDVMNKLKEFGIVLGHDGAKLENQFLQVANKPETLLALKLMVDANFNRLTTMLNLYNKTRNRQLLDSLDSGFHFNGLMLQLVPLIQHFTENEKHPITVNKNVLHPEEAAEWVNYDPMQYGCLPLCNVYVRDSYGLCPSSFDLSKIKTQPMVLKMAMGDADLISRGLVDVRLGNAHSLSRSDLQKLVDASNPHLDGEQYHCQFYIKPKVSLEHNNLKEDRPSIMR